MVWGVMVVVVWLARRPYGLGGGGRGEIVIYLQIF